MKREEQIITEAKKYYSDSINCHNAFLHGVEWADEHPVDVWHDAYQIPMGKYRWVLVQLGVDRYDVRQLLDDDKWCVWSKGRNIIRWAYISDLLPKGGKE